MSICQTTQWGSLRVPGRQSRVTHLATDAIIGPNNLSTATTLVTRHKRQGDDRNGQRGEHESDLHQDLGQFMNLIFESKPFVHGIERLNFW